MAVRGAVRGRASSAARTCRATSRRTGVARRLAAPRPTRRCGCEVSQLALGRRAVLPAHRQAAGAQGHRDRGHAQAGAAPGVPAARLGRRAAEPAGPHGAARTRACRCRWGRRSPARRMRIRPVNMEFRYGTSFMSQSPEAYERLILDAMRGDATLFTRNDEVEAQWAIIDPILAGLARGHRRADPAVRGRLGRARGGRRAARGRRSAGGGCERVTEDVWRERDTTPDDDRGGAARAAARAPRRRATRASPARVLNLVVIVDREWQRRDREPARARRPLPPVAHDPVRGRGGRARRSTRGRRVADRGRRAGPSLASAASASRSTSGRAPPRRRSTRSSTRCWSPTCATMVWAPHGHAEAVDALRRLAHVVLIDSQDEPDVAAALARAGELLEDAYVVDLAWLRSTPWRERIAAAFDPPALRGAARRDRRRSPCATARTRAAAALLFCGWLSLAPGLAARARSSRRRRPLQRPRARRAAARSRSRSSRSSSPSAPGLAGRDDRDGLGRGRCRSTARPGGLRAVRRARDGERAGVDGARRLARRGRHPRRGRPPGAAARPDLRPALAAARALMRSCVSGRDRGRRGSRRPRCADAGRAPPSAAATSSLTGGSTPRARLRDSPPSGDADWSGATVWFGDERCVPPDDADSNFADGGGAARAGSSEAAARSCAWRASSAPRPPPAPTRRCCASTLGADPRFDLLLLGHRPRRPHRVAVPRQAGARASARGWSSACRSRAWSRWCRASRSRCPALNGARDGRVPGHRRGQGRGGRARVRRPARSRARPPAHVRPDAGSLFVFLDEAAAAKLRMSDQFIGVDVGGTKIASATLEDGELSRRTS